LCVEASLNSYEQEKPAPWRHGNGAPHTWIGLKYWKDGDLTINIETVGLVAKGGSDDAVVEMKSPTVAADGTS
jgi:hypothetical protein